MVGAGPEMHEVATGVGPQGMTRKQGSRSQGRSAGQDKVASSDRGY